MPTLRYPLVPAFLIAYACHFPLLKAAEPRSPQRLDTLLQQAALAEKSEKWELAVASYLELVTSGHATPAVRDKLSRCLRRAAQSRRFRDLQFQHYVQSLEPSQSLDLYADVLHSLSNNFVSRQAALPRKLFVHGLDEWERALLDLDFRQKHLKVRPEMLTQYRSELAELRLKPPTSLAECRQKLLGLIPEAQAKLGLLNASAMVFEFLCGACNGLDEYTVYVMPDRTRTRDAEMILEFAGYGVLLRAREDAFIVESIVPESYADLNLPLQVGDRLVRLNGISVNSTQSLDLSMALRTPNMGKHECEWLRFQGTGVMPVRTRMPVPMPSVLKTEILKEGIGYLKLGQIRENAAFEVDEALIRLREQGMPLRGLILDLRGNPGGNFLSGVQVAERFVPTGILVTTRGQAPEFSNRVFSSASGNAAFELPVVVLVDGRTMSAAEILTVALKGHGRALVVGMPTYGKGGIQCPIRLDTDMLPKKGSLIVSIAHAFGPNQELIHNVGVIPDLIEADSERQLPVALERLNMILGPMR